MTNSFFSRRGSGLATAVLLTLIALVGPAAAQRPASWIAPHAPFKVAGDIYYVGTAGLSSFLITGDAGHILLDGGVPENAAMIEANINALGFKLSDIKILLNSHAHFDHSGGLAQLKKSTGARLVASEGDRVALETGKYIGSEEVRAYDFPPVKVDQVIADGQSVSVGEVGLTARITPGHTRGCTSWTTVVEDARRKRSVIFFCSGTVAANRLAPRPQYPGIVEDYRATFARARTLRADIYLAPHGEQFDMDAKLARRQPGKANPFIDATELGRRIDAFETAFKTELARQQGAKP